MELVPGESLDDLLNHTGPMHEGVIRRYVKQILWALKYCHEEMGILHRG
jgi:serine/threonine protein kinase